MGTGRFAQASQVDYGIDVSAGVLKFAKQREIAVVKGMEERLPFVDSFFGAVFIIVTLCFVDDPVKVLKEALRVLRDEGAVVLGLILNESPWAGFYEGKGEAGNIFYRIAKFYSFEEVKIMSGKAGIEILEVSSTVFQAPIETSINLELLKGGYFKQAGFVAVKLGKVNSQSANLNHHRTLNTFYKVGYSIFP